MCVCVSGKAYLGAEMSFICISSRAVNDAAKDWGHTNLQVLILSGKHSSEPFSILGILNSQLICLESSNGQLLL